MPGLRHEAAYNAVSKEKEINVKIKKNSKRYARLLER